MDLVSRLPGYRPSGAPFGLRRPLLYVVMSNPYLLFTSGMLVYRFIQSLLKKIVKSRTVLELNLDGKEVKENSSDATRYLSFFFGKETFVMAEIVETLEQAANDSRVIGLIVRLGENKLGWAQLQEIHAAVKRFRATGKPAICWAESFGEAQAAHGAYYLATAFDKIYMAPCGSVSLTGFLIDHPFVRGLLDKLGIKPYIGQRRSFKTFANTFMEKGFTPAHKQQLDTLVQQLKDMFSNTLSAERGISKEDVEKLLENGPHVASEAISSNLVDQLAYYDEVYEDILLSTFNHVRGVKKRRDINLLFFDVYHKKRGSLYRKGKKCLALITAEGTIHQGTSDSPNKSSSIGSDTVCAALRQAAKDSSIDAVLLRVNSGGGSFVASDIIAREVSRVKEKGKKVIVSISNVAASGGYYISHHADAMFAMPGSIVGSIGVVAGKMQVRDMFEKIGVTFDSVSTSESSKYYSFLHDYSNGTLQKRDHMLDWIYEHFKNEVASARGLSAEDVESIAQGQIYLGEAALTAKLVDRIGGLYDSLMYSKEILGLQPTDSIKVKTFPPPLTLLSFLKRKESENSEEAEEQGSFASIVPLSILQSFFRIIRLISPILHHAEQIFPRSLQGNTELMADGLPGMVA